MVGPWGGADGRTFPTVEALDMPEALRHLTQVSALAPIVRLERVDDASESDLFEVAGLGFGIDLRARADFDLRRIAGPLKSFRYVEVGGDPGYYSGWDVLQNLDSAERIYIFVDVPSTVRFDGLPRLQAAFLWRRSGLSAANNPNVVELDLEIDEFTGSEQFSAPISTLSVRGKRGRFSFQAIANPETLTWAQIIFPGIVDVTALNRARNLKYLRLVNSAAVLGVSALAELENLGLLECEGVKSAPNFDALASRTMQTIVRSNQIADREFQARVASPSSWLFQRYRSPGAGWFGLEDERPREITFQDWDSLEARTGTLDDDESSVEIMERICRTIIAEDLPQAVAHGPLQFDSDFDSIRLAPPDGFLPSSIQAVLNGAWRDKPRIKRIGKIVRSELRSQTEPS